ncbi:hypothetical protein KFL_000650040 [Klebsormidium nitens]|uniref:Uncharacterized protein n=1 Tax=Klebsormidium nitens TaxID=105231 RepID=A0A1Y1HV70_KLENI|nr:hypothetical protein KFL_000650040 [Klebsormidium nitens]|eukprot:GAQ80871.1 hypothetical protein KFL_000650040 [Klebsormidium nitens]
MEQSKEVTMAKEIPSIWEWVKLAPRNGKNGIVYLSLVTVKPLSDGTKMKCTVFDPVLEQPKKGAVEVFFYDELHTHKVRRPGRFIDEDWWAAHGPPHMSWEELGGSSRTFSTTAGQCMGLLGAQDPYGIR